MVNPVNLAAEQLAAERGALKRELLARLVGMQRDLATAVAAIDADSPINANLMQHAISVSERIGRWNLIQLLAPYFKEQS